MNNNETERIEKIEEEIIRLKKLKPKKIIDASLKAERRTRQLTLWVFGVIGSISVVITAISGYQTINYQKKIFEINTRQRELNNSLETYQYIVKAMNSSSYEERIKNYNKAIENEPNNPMNYYYRAITIYNNDRQDSEGNAYNDATMAISLDNKFIDAYFLRGQISLSKNDNHNAYNDFLVCYNNQELLTMTDGNGILNLVSNAAFNSLDYPKAIPLLIEREKFERSQGYYLYHQQSVLHQLAISYKETNDYDNAIKYYEEILENSSDNFFKLDICNNLRNIYIETNNEEKIQEYELLINNLENSNQNRNYHNDEK